MGVEQDFESFSERCHFFCILGVDSFFGLCLEVFEITFQIKLIWHRHGWILLARSELSF